MPEPAAVTVTERRATGRAVYAAMLRDRAYLAYLVAITLGTVTYVQSSVSLPLEIVRDGYPTWLYSAVLATSSVILISCELKITAYITRIPTYLAVGAGHALNAIGLAVYGLAVHAGAFVVLGMVVYVAGMMTAAPSMFAHPATFPAALKARYLAAMHAVTGLAGAVAPLFGVYLWERFGQGFWAMAGLTAAVAGAFAVYGIKRDADRRAAEALRPETVEPAGGTA